MARNGQIRETKTQKTPSCNPLPLIPIGTISGGTYNLEMEKMTDGEVQKEAEQLYPNQLGKQIAFCEGLISIRERYFMTRKEETREAALKVKGALEITKDTFNNHHWLQIYKAINGLIEIILELTEPESMEEEDQEKLWRELIEDTRPFAEIYDEIERHKSKFHLTRKPL